MYPIIIILCSISQVNNERNRIHRSQVNENEQSIQPNFSHLNDLSILPLVDSWFGQPATDGNWFYGCDESMTHQHKVCH